MFVCRGYRINPNGEGDLIVSVVMFGYSEKVLRRRMRAKPGVKKITVEPLNPQFEETVIAEGLVTR